MGFAGNGDCAETASELSAAATTAHILNHLPTRSLPCRLLIVMMPSVSCPGLRTALPVSPALIPFLHSTRSPASALQSCRPCAAALPLRRPSRHEHRSPQRLLHAPVPKPW